MSGEHAFPDLTTGFAETEAEANLGWLHYACGLLAVGDVQYALAGRTRMELAQKAAAIIVTKVRTGELARRILEGNQGSAKAMP